MDEQTIHKYRYGLEHIAIPQSLFASAKIFIKMMLIEQGHLFADLYESVELKGRENNQVCPYDLSDFKIRPMVITSKDHTSSPDFAVIEIDMPKPETATDCRRVFICHDRDFQNPAYFTDELTAAGYYFLCEWTANHSHVNYGKCPPTSVDLFSKISGMYADRLVNPSGFVLPTGLVLPS